MSSIQCACGNRIYDNTDYLPDKALFISDQDYEDMIVEMRREIRKLIAGVPPYHDISKSNPELQFDYLLTGIIDIIGNYERIIHQCDECGRFYIPDQKHRYYIFKPEGNTETQLLRSMEGDNWRSFLEAHWDSGSKQGRIIQRTGLADSVDLFTNNLELEARYYQIFEERKQKGALRRAKYSRDGVIVHRWEWENQKEDG